jgi:putative transposase
VTQESPCSAGVEALSGKIGPCVTTPRPPDALLAVRLPLSPNVSQEREFWRYAGVARWAYNWCLARWKQQYEATGKGSSAYALQKELALLKRTAEFAWLKDVSKHVPEQAANAVEAAFKNFFRRLKTGGKPGYPRFKKRGASRAAFAFTFPASETQLRGRQLRLPRIGPVAIARRRFEDRIPAGGRITRVTVSHDGRRWFAAILFRVPAPAAPVPPTGPSVGVDLGLTHFAVLSDGRKIAAPKPLKWAQRKLRREQRRLSRRKPGSGRRERQRRKVARLHCRVRNVRQSFLHGLSAMLSKNHGQIGIETLNVRGMMANGRLARAIADAGWGEFRRQLEYKCRRTGAVLVEHDRWFASSKLCSSCGRKHDGLELGHRRWRCAGCGAVHDRDVNAAVNLAPANGGEVRVEGGGHAGSNADGCRPVKREDLAANYSVC